MVVMCETDSENRGNNYSSASRENNELCRVAARQAVTCIELLTVIITSVDAVVVSL